MSLAITRRLFCAGTLVPAATLWLPGCGGGLGETDAPAQSAAIAMRAAALAPPPGLAPNRRAHAARNVRLQGQRAARRVQGAQARTASRPLALCRVAKRTMVANGCAISTRRT